MGHLKFRCTYSFGNLTQFLINGSESTGDSAWSIYILQAIYTVPHLLRLIGVGALTQAVPSNFVHLPSGIIYHPRLCRVSHRCIPATLPITDLKVVTIKDLKDCRNRISLLRKKNPLQKLRCRARKKSLHDQSELDTPCVSFSYVIRRGSPVA